MKNEEPSAFPDITNEHQKSLRRFHDLMPCKVEEVLLVASLYDSFTLEEDGRLGQRIQRHFVEHHLSTPPLITRVSSGTDALDKLATGKYDLVVTMLNLPDQQAEQFITTVKQHNPNLPIIILTWDREGLRRREDALYQAGLDRAFLWNGDSEIFLAMIKLVEDQLNLDHDVKQGDVRLLVMVEDSVRYYSSFLPILYQAILHRTRALMDQSLNDMDKLFRMRARAKLLLAHTFEQALSFIDSYPDNVLGFISDIRYKREEQEDPHAGFRLLDEVRKSKPDIPFLLLSSEPENAELARIREAAFLDKNSPQLLIQVEQFLQFNLGFGPFIFRNLDQSVIDRADSLDELATKLELIPLPVMEYHSRANHFSHWLAARGEFKLAAAIRPTLVSDFSDLESARKYLVAQIRKTRKKQMRGTITDMHGFKLDPSYTFVRIGTGSLGGKSRGIAFLEAMLEKGWLADQFPDIEIGIPPTIALGSFLFSRFVEENNLRHLATSDTTDEETIAAFTAASLPPEITKRLQAVLNILDVPLAVRSSSLQEDSADQPFAGVFATCMLPNNHPDLETRLAQLCQAIKQVYASTWSRRAIRYLKATGKEAADERMGVAIQALVGKSHGQHFYPWISGVAKTHDFYPFRYIKTEDGVAETALGLGKTVVEGGNALRFCPAHPLIVPQLTDLDRILDSTQKSFWAMDLEKEEWGPDGPLVKLTLDHAEADGELANLVSVFSAQDNRLLDGLRGQGPRIITFAPVLKWEKFPLAKLLQQLLGHIRTAMAGPAEIEFAVMPGDPENSIKPTFSLLQVRPVPETEIQTENRPAEYAKEDIIVASTRAMGNGLKNNITDLVYVDRNKFNRLETPQIVPEIEFINDQLLASGRKYILIGPGRWGTADPPLGIPITWDQISSAAGLVEVDLPGYEIDPSQGSHFFHNLTSFRVFFMAIGLRNEQESMDWEWLESINPTWSGKYIHHLRFADPLSISADGKTGQGWVVKGSNS